MVGVGSWVETERKYVKPFRLAQLEAPLLRCLNTRLFGPSGVIKFDYL